MTFLSLKKKSLLVGVTLTLFFGAYGSAFAVVPTWDNGLSGSAPQFVTQGVGASTGWFTSKEFSNLGSFSFSDLLPSWDSIVSYVMRYVMNYIRNLAFSWIQNSDQNQIFQGMPMFVQDPTQFFDQIADQAGGAFLSGFQQVLGTPGAPGTGFPNGGNICSQFGQQIRNMMPTSGFSRSTDYTGMGAFGSRATCTMNIPTNNLGNFYQNFSNGGWNSWQSIMQTNNNPYGVYLAALDTKLGQESRAQMARQQELQWGSGYLPVQGCVDGAVQGPNPQGCLGNRYKTKTPGRAVSDRITANIGSDIAQTVQADEINELIQGIVTQLIDQLSNNLKQGLDEVRTWL